MSEKLAPCPTDDLVKPWPFNGYAPGDYASKCMTCEEIVVDLDKRATTCLECAVKHAKDRIEQLEADKAELVEEMSKASVALEPMAWHVFNDNGDISFNGPCYPDSEECIRAYFAQRKIASLVAKHGGGET